MRATKPIRFSKRIVVDPALAERFGRFPSGAPLAETEPIAIELQASAPAGGSTAATVIHQRAGP
jgi:hypothetical protein